MTLLVDTSLVLALFNTRDPFHRRAVAFYDDIDEDVYTTPMIAAEMDHLIAQRAGAAAVARLWDDFDRGAILLRWWSTATAETLAIVRERPKLGLADASLLASACRHVMVVVESGKTRTRAVREAIERIEVGGGQIVGVTLTKSTAESSQYGYRLYQYGAVDHRRSEVIMITKQAEIS